MPGNVLCKLEKNVYSGAVEWNVLYKCGTPIWSVVLLKSTVWLLLFCLDDLPNVESGILKSRSIIVMLSISELISSLL